MAVHRLRVLIFSVPVVLSVFVALAPVASANQGAARAITSVTFSGHSKAPRVIVKGRGFGARPSFNPPYQPQQHQNCPAQNPATDGHDHGTSFWFQDVRASAGNTPLWTAGRYRGAPELDCIGLVIDGWSATRIAFHFGIQYNRPSTAAAPSTYVLSSGDPFILKVKNATFRGTVKLTP